MVKTAFDMSGPARDGRRAAAVAMIDWSGTEGIVREKGVYGIFDVSLTFLAKIEKFRVPFLARGEPRSIRRNQRREDSRTHGKVSERE